MTKPITAIALGGGITLAALGFVGMFLWVESPPEDDQIQVITLSDELDADQPRPTEVDPSDYETRQSGLMVYDMQVGTGDKPVEGQIVKVAYSGWLADGGKMFDSSVHRGRPPLEFQIGRPGIIPGWQEGVADMRVGGKRQLVIPPALAYGKKGSPPVIPPEATLVFDVELVELGEIRVPPKYPDLDLATDSRAEELDKGVKVVDLEAGSGPLIEDGSVVVTELTVWNQDHDQVFSTLDDRRSAKYWVGGGRAERPPFEGMDIGLRGMREGGTRFMEIPAEVALGAKGQPPRIPPDSTVYVQVTPKDVSAPRVVPEAIVAFDRAAMTTTESGLMYLDLVEGDGETPTAGDFVFTEYSGWLEDGTLFDSSYKRRDALSFPLFSNSVIKAWDEAISTMKVGGKRVIVAPADLAYGDQAQGQIPAGATLIFEIELVRVMKRPH